MTLDDDAYFFSDAADGTVPWKPCAHPQLRPPACGSAVGLEHLGFHYLRKFMETYGQDMELLASGGGHEGRHDPSVAPKHYTDRAKVVLGG